MRKELDKKLCEKYPKIFRDRNESPRVTSMYWGFSCDDGWYGLIDALCATIKRHAEKEDLDVRAVQVKEKFGGLRFYIYGGDDAIYEYVHFAEMMSYHICEKCGMTGPEVSQTKGGWIKTLCEACKGDK